jgi:HTH-type transcriptional regulator/antitoxin MqsA
MSDTRIHPETGQELRRDVRRQTVTFGSLSRVVDVPGWYPDGDGDALFDGADLHTANTAFKELRSEYGGHVKAVRKARGLTQEEAGHIIGGGPRAFQKYESGKTPPSDAAVGLIEVLDKHPEALATLREVRSKLMAGAASVVDAKENADPKLVRRGRRGKATAKLAKARG